MFHFVLISGWEDGTHVREGFVVEVKKKRRRFKGQHFRTVNFDKHACQSQGDIGPALNAPRKPLPLFLPISLTWLKATTEESMANILNLPPNDDSLVQPQPEQCQEDKQRPSVSIKKTVFSSHIILSVMSSSDSKGIPVSYIIIIICSPQR